MITQSPEMALDSLKQMLDALNCGAAMIDRSGVVVYVNARLCSMMQVSCSKLVGASIFDLYADAKDRELLNKSLASFENQAETEFHLPMPDGTKLPIIASARPLSGPAPLNDHRIITMIDVSRQKDAENQMKEQYDHILEMSDTLLQQALELKRYSNTLEHRVRERTAQLHEAHMDAIYMLAVASEAKDEDTGRHVRRIERYTRELAMRLGYSDAESNVIGYSAILHDIGKIHVPDNILAKPGPLDESERARMQLHTLAGERILAGSPFFERARQIARGHHENWDGSGYPDAIGGTKIPMDARIVHVADVFDALTHERVYKKPWPKPEAIEAIVGAAGTMFDPQVVAAFEAAIAEGTLAPNGSSHN